MFSIPNGGSDSHMDFVGQFVYDPRLKVLLEVADSKGWEDRPCQDTISDGNRVGRSNRCRHTDGAREQGDLDDTRDSR